MNAAHVERLDWTIVCSTQCTLAKEPPRASTRPDHEKVERECIVSNHMSSERAVVTLNLTTPP